MPIEAHLEGPAKAVDRRRAPRRKLHLDLPGRSGLGAPVNVTVMNISRTGMLLETTAELAVGETIEVLLPHGGLRTALVAWRSYELIGCKFTQPLVQADISAAELRGAPRRGGRPPNTPGSPKPAARESFGAKLKRLRQERGLTQTRLAVLLQVSKPTVCNWESGRTRPRARSLESLAAALGVSAAELTAQPRGSEDADPGPA